MWKSCNLKQTKKSNILLSQTNFDDFHRVFHNVTQIFRYQCSSKIPCLFFLQIAKFYHSLKSPLDACTESIICLFVAYFWKATSQISSSLKHFYFISESLFYIQISGQVFGEGGISASLADFHFENHSLVNYNLMIHDEWDRWLNWWFMIGVFTQTA